MATGAGAWGPCAPPATHSPPQGLGPASLTYFRPARDKGGLSSSAQAEKDWEVAVVGAWPACWTPASMALFPGEPTGPGYWRNSGVTPDTQPVLRFPSHPTRVSGKPQRKDYRGQTVTTPYQTSPELVQDHPSSCKGCSRTSSQTPYECLGLSPESLGLSQGASPDSPGADAGHRSANCPWLSWGTATPPRAVLRHPQLPERRL